MKKFNTFYFTKFEFNRLTLQAIFYYSFDNEVFFEELIDFKNELFEIRDEIDYSILNNILFNIHIALGISYYKLYPTKNLIIKSGILDEYQVNFWKNFYINGLGEFLYTNKISPEGLLNFKSHADNQYIKKDFILGNKVLVSIGGGKDSIVSIELLKKAGVKYDLFVFGKGDNLKINTAKVIGKELLLIKRTLSSNLFKLNNKGYYNGHVPITGIIAFIKIAVGYIYNYKYLVLSNEKSANYGNTEWNGFSINHQYSKSLEFEKDFGKYVNKYISSDIKYFSLLRGMYEVKIAQLFSEFGSKYFSIFSSCNNNFKINKNLKNNTKIWCNKCPKCVFVFSILRPYLNNNQILEIFGEDLFERNDLEYLFQELLGISGIKPLECVGEAEEVIYSMFLSFKKYYTLPYILDKFQDKILQSINNVKLNILEKKLVTIYNEDIIPEEFKKLIFNNINKGENNQL